jgi:hypothetical protein
MYLGFLHLCNKKVIYYLVFIKFLFKTINKETSNKETSNKETSNKETSNKETSNKEKIINKFNMEFFKTVLITFWL